MSRRARFPKEPVRFSLDQLQAPRVETVRCTYRGLFSGCQCLHPADPATGRCDCHPVGLEPSY